MDSKKCVRCGCFFISDTATCPKCEQKDINEMSSLKSYLQTNSYPNSIEDLSTKTGITLQNLSRFLDNENFNYLEIKD
ncbi:MAG: hypothetical protein Q4G05_00380 [Clostridia bacterium]|nr:hypothetical protein [Clostridia bacterium]